MDKVEQGWIRSAPPYDAWSEAVVVHFRPTDIPMETLVEIHLLTHSSTSEHAMREKYRSAVYVFDEEQREKAERALTTLREESRKDFVTDVLPFREFRLNEDDLLNYYRTRPEAPFCTTYIHPKLAKLRQHFGALVKSDAHPETREPHSV